MPDEKFLEKLKSYGEANNIPNISRENAQFLRSLIQENWYQKALEIGTANAYSTIHFALELEKVSWSITTIEFSQAAYEMAQDNIEDSDLKNITQYFWDARDIIPHLEESYDFIFIDGLKKASLSFLLIVWGKVSPWGIIIIDDVIKFRYKMENLYEYLSTHEIKYTIEHIDSDDGIMIIKK